MRAKKQNRDQNSNAWINYAEEYHRCSSFSDHLIHIGLGLPGLSPSEIVKESESILDIGCGTGLNSILLSKYVQGNVVGIDPVYTWIQEASIKYQDSKIVFLCYTFQELLEQITNSYDLVTFFGSLDYISLDDTFFYVMDKITHIGSRCFITKFHPFWTTLFGNDVGDMLNNSYFENGREDIVKFGTSEFIRYHYPISDLLTRFQQNGWQLLSFSEPKPNIAQAAFAYNGYEHDSVLQQRLSTIPMTAVYEFEKEK